MGTYKRQLRDKDGNTIYPDVGLELDDVIYGDDPGQVETPSPWIETGDIKNGQITSSKLKGWSTANTTDEWVPVATSNYELQHRLIKPFNADGTIPTSAIANSAVTSAKIDWTTTRIASAPTIISTTTDYITLNSGYSISYNNVYTLGKIVIMNLMIKSDSGYPNNSQVKVGTLTSAFKPAYNNINTYGHHQGK